MAALAPDDRTILNKKYPFLSSFPFKEFKLEVGELPTAPVADPGLLEEETAPSKYDSPIVRFLYEHLGTRFAINIHENDLAWIYDRAKDVRELDTITQALDRGLASNDLLVRRDVIEISDDWMKRLSDKKTMLAYSTFTEALTSLIGQKSITAATELINNINKLSNRKGLISLTEDDSRIIMTYYHFRIVYTKIILGIVIASKISI